MSLSQFLDEVSDVEKSINVIKVNIERIQELQTQILVSTSSGQEDYHEKERNSLMVSTKDLLFKTKDRIKKIEYENIRLPSSDSNLILRKQRHNFLHEKFTNILEEYRRSEDAYVRQQKERMARQYRVVNPDANQQEIDDYLSNPSGQPVFQQALLQAEAKNALADVKKRHGDIKQIEQTIFELASLFREMQLQVEEQDSVLVSVEDSVTESLVKIEIASSDIEIAHKSSLEARKKKWILFGIAAVIILIIIIVIIVNLPKS